MLSVEMYTKRLARLSKNLNFGFAKKHLMRSEAKMMKKLGRKSGRRSTLSYRACPEITKIEKHWWRCCTEGEDERSRMRQREKEKERGMKKKYREWERVTEMER